MPSTHIDRNLLFGFLALQNNFISHDDLVAAVSVWLTDKTRPLDEILSQRRALADDERQLLEALVRKHLQKHGDDAERSLAALSSVGKLRDDLKKLGDPDVEASLAHVATARPASLADPNATLPVDPNPTLPVDPSSVEKTRFRILRPHAAGGLGQVYVARDDQLNREVALKEIKFDFADDSSSRNRFLLEAEITGGLEHPGIVPVYGLGQYADGRPYYAMRFIRGDSLKEAIARFHTPVGQAASLPKTGATAGSPKSGATAGLPSSARRTGPNFESLEFRQLLGRFIDVCNAIEYAHSRGVLHRDLKPGNIMLGKYGETLVVDWGLAKPKGKADQHDQSDEQTLQPRSATGSTATQMGAAVGTPAYMSPEQAAGRLDQLGPASDVYSLGATLYSVLTGQVPFAKRSPGDILRKVQSGDFTPPRVLSPQIPRPLEAICLRAMALRPADRYPSPQALSDDLERYLADEPIKAHSEPVTLRARRWLRKHPRTIAALAATLLVGLTSAIVIASFVADRNKQLASANFDLQAANVAERNAKNEAESKRKETELARFEQEKALRSAEAVSNYLVHVFRSPDPGRGGRTIAMADVLDRSISDLNDQFNDDPHTKPTLLDAIAQSYMGLGLYHEAIPIFQEARDLNQSKLSAYHPGTSNATHSLATAYQSAGKLDLALPLFEEALKLNQSQMGPDHPQTLASMNSLALAYQSAEKLDLALPLFEETLKLMQAKLGPKHPDTLRLTGNLADSYLDVGRRDKFMPLQAETLELSKANLGADHPQTLSLMINFANGYLSVGRHSEALPLYEEALKLTRAKLGPDHPQTLSAMHSLAAAYRAVGNHDLALPLFEETLKRMQATLGPEHPRTLTSMNNLAFAYQSAHRLDLALPLLEEAQKLTLSTLGPEHPQSFISTSELANTYLLVGKLDRAVPLFEQTLKFAQAKFGPDHSDTLTLMVNLANAHLNAQQFDQALPLFEAFIAGHRRRSGTGENGFARWLYIVSRDLLEHKQFAAAETYIRELVAIIQKQDANNWVAPYANSLLGRSLAGQTKFAQAESLLVEGYVGMKRDEAAIPADGTPYLTEALQALLDLYTAWDKPDEAAKWKRQLEDHEAAAAKPVK